MKDIKGYEGLYAITSCGKVWSYRNEKFLKPQNTGRGYLKVNLYKDGRCKNFKIHRLVAETYIPNPNNYTDVNHIDENKSNNCINNLQWTSHAENINYGTRNARAAKSISKPVYCVELDTLFDSLSIAAQETGAQVSGICDCCRGRRQTANGYHWEYRSIVL